MVVPFGLCRLPSPQTQVSRCRRCTCCSVSAAAPVREAGMAGVLGPCAPCTLLPRREADSVTVNRVRLLQVMPSSVLSPRSSTLLDCGRLISNLIRDRCRFPPVRASFVCIVGWSPRRLPFHVAPCHTLGPDLLCARAVPSQDRCSASGLRFAGHEPKPAQRWQLSNLCPNRAACNLAQG